LPNTQPASDTGAIPVLPIGPVTAANWTRSTIDTVKNPAVTRTSGAGGEIPNPLPVTLSNLSVSQGALHVTQRSANGSDLTQPDGLKTILTSVDLLDHPPSEPRSVIPTYTVYPYTEGGGGTKQCPYVFSSDGHVKNNVAIGPILTERHSESQAAFDSDTISTTAHKGATRRHAGPLLYQSVTDDLRDILRRSHYLHSTVASVPAKDTSRITLAIPVMPMVDQTNFLGYCSQMYAGWTGSLRYHFVFESDVLDGYTFTAVHLPDVNVHNYGVYTTPGNEPQSVSDSFGSGYALTVQPSPSDRSVLVEVPYASNYHLLTTRPAGRLRFSQNGTLLVTLRRNINLTPEASNIKPISFETFISIGDDFGFHVPVPGFLPLPEVAYGQEWDFPELPTFPSV
jgi:hypothetical protein